MVKQHKKRALASLKGNWGLGVGTSLLAQIVIGAGSSVVYFPLMLAMIPFAAMEGSGVDAEVAVVPGAGAYVLMLLLYALYLGVTLFLTGIMTMGQLRVFLDIADGRGGSIDGLFSYFRGWSRMWQACRATILVAVYTLLWSLLLVIPGIVKSFSYSLTYFILLEKPDLTVREAIQESRRLMKGRKLDLFLLYLSFIGWIILGMVTLGIAFLWIVPYMTTAFAHFYRQAAEAA